MSQETSFVGEPSSSTTSPAQHAFSTANIASSAGDAPSSSSSSSYSSSRSSLAVSITEEIRLKKHLGLMNGVAIIVGIIVGSGIFISPKGVILEAGSVGSSLAIWGLCGVVCLFGAMCYAELGTAIVKLLTLLLLMIVSGREHYGGHPPKKATGPDEWGGHYYKNHCGVRHLHLSQRRDTSDTGGWLCGLFSCILDLCGFACLFGDMCYAEIGTAIVKSGADYAYISEAYGSFPSFLYLWVAVIIVLPTGNAITALTFANYILQPIFPECDSPPYMVNLFAALCICLLTFINCRNVTWATRVQDIFTCTKIFALIIIIIVGLVKIGMGATDNFERSFEGTTTEPGKMALAFYSGLFSYSGWNYLNFVTEELKDPYKNLPRAICISLPMVTVIYILANIAYFGVMTPAEMIASDAVAVTFADRTLGVMSWTMPVFVACSTFGSLNGAIFTSSRLFFVGARHGHLPGFLATINLKYMTPLPSLLFGCVMSLIMLSSSDIYSLINYASFVETLFIGMSVSGLLILRITQPQLKRPIKVSLIFPIFYLIVCAFLIVTPLTSSPMECLMGLIMIATGIPVYMLGVMWKRKPEGFHVALESFSSLTQKLFYAVHEETKQD